MKAFGGLALGLSLVFGCLFLALLAEVYYLLWWRKRIRCVTDESEDVNENTTYAKDILHLICSKGAPLNPSLVNRLGSSASNADVGGITGHSNGQEHDLELGTSEDLPLSNAEEESLDAELMRLHNLAGPPRFLFTITEESKEDMDSEDGKSMRKGSRTRSLSDILTGLETQASPLKPSLSPKSIDSNAGFSFNTPAVANGSSPPPKFKFLRDAEAKLLRRLMEEAEKKRSDGYGSLLRIGVVEASSKEKDRIQIVPSPRNFPSSSSQVLPLASSPTTSFRPTDERKISSVHRS